MVMIFKFTKSQEGYVFQLQAIWSNIFSTDFHS